MDGMDGMDGMDSGRESKVKGRLWLRLCCAMRLVRTERSRCNG